MAEFARIQGWNRSTVTRLRHAGRLVMRGELVDVEASRALLADTADPRRGDVAARHAAQRLQKTQNPPPQAAIAPPTVPAPQAPADRPAAADLAAADTPPGPVAPSPADLHGLTFQAARAKKEHYLALQAEAEYKRAIGALLPLPEVIAALDDIIAVVRQGFEQLPNAAAPRLHQQDVDVIRATLREDIGAVFAEVVAESRRQLATLQAGAPSPGGA